MQSLKLQFKAQSLWYGIMFILVVSYFLTRFYHLTIIPVFADEAIYIRWAQVMRAVQSLRFLPLSDGKQPLFMWLIIPFLKVIKDPLIAGRMVSIFSGFGSMVGVGLLSYLVFKKKEIALFAAIFYLISPFTFFFDRMALSDGLLSMFGIWFLICAVLLTKKLRLDLAMIAGIILGLGLLTKSPALFFALMLPLTLILIPCHSGLASPSEAVRSWDPESIKINKINLFCRFQIKSGMTWRVIKRFGYWLIIYLFGYAIYNILRLGPEFHMIAIRNKDYIFSFSEVLKHPFNPLIGNIKDTLTWYWILLTPISFLLGILGIYFSFKKDYKSTIFLVFCLFFPLFAQGSIAKVYTARYVLFTVPYFLIFIAVFVDKVFSGLKNKTLTTVLLIFFFFYPVFQISLLIFNPQKAWLPKNERSGYLEMWTSGYGIKESADYLKNIAGTQKVLVGTEGYFGTLPDGLQIYLEKVPNITVIGVGYPIKNISSKLSDGLIDSRVFLLVNDSRFNCPSCNLKIIRQYPKAINSYGLQENLILLEINGD